MIKTSKAKKLLRMCLYMDLSTHSRTWDVREGKSVSNHKVTLYTLVKTFLVWIKEESSRHFLFAFRRIDSWKFIRILFSLVSYEASLNLTLTVSLQDLQLSKTRICTDYQSFSYLPKTSGSSPTLLRDNFVSFVNERVLQAKVFRTWRNLKMVFLHNK